MSPPSCVLTSRFSGSHTRRSPPEWVRCKRWFGVTQTEPSQISQPSSDHPKPVFYREPQPIYFVLLHGTAVCNGSTKKVEVRHHALDSAFTFESRLEQVPVGRNDD